MQITVRDLMTSEPLTLRELATVEEATRRILERAVNEAYIVDEDGRLLGTVSDFALLKARLIQTDAQEPVTQFMSRNMVLLSPEMRLDDVAGYFRESCCPRLAVIDGGRVVGQLSRRDVLRAMVVINEITTESGSDDFDAVVPLNAANSCGNGRIRRLETPEATILPEPAGLRSASDCGTAKSEHSLSSLATR